MRLCPIRARWWSLLLGVLLGLTRHFVNSMVRHIYSVLKPIRNHPQPFGSHFDPPQFNPIQTSLIILKIGLLLIIMTYYDLITWIIIVFFGLLPHGLSWFPSMVAMTLMTRSVILSGWDRGLRCPRVSQGAGRGTAEICFEREWPPSS